MEYNIYVDLVCDKVGKRIPCESSAVNKGFRGYYRECDFRESEVETVICRISKLKVYNFNPTKGKTYRIRFLQYINKKGELETYAGMVIGCVKGKN